MNTSKDEIHIYLNTDIETKTIPTPEKVKSYSLRLEQVRGYTNTAVPIEIFENDLLRKITAQYNFCLDIRYNLNESNPQKNEISNILPTLQELINKLQATEHNEHVHELIETI